MKVIKERREEWVQCLAEDVSSSQQGNVLGSNTSGNSVDSLEAIKSSTFFARRKSASTSSTRLAFLDLLLQHHLVTRKLSLEDLREEVDTFMFAVKKRSTLKKDNNNKLTKPLSLKTQGHDTTSHAISWTLYMLGLYPEVQAKAVEEVDHLVDVEGADIVELTVENLKSLKYLECVLKEVQRIYPTAPFIGRELSEDTKISKITVSFFVTSRLDF